MHRSCADPVLRRRRRRDDGIRQRQCHPDDDRGRRGGANRHRERRDHYHDWRRAGHRGAGSGNRRRRHGPLPDARSRRNAWPCSRRVVRKSRANPGAVCRQRRYDRARHARAAVAPANASANRSRGAARPETDHFRTVTERQQRCQSRSRRGDGPRAARRRIRFPEDPPGADPRTVRRHSGDRQRAGYPVCGPCAGGRRRGAGAGRRDCDDRSPRRLHADAAAAQRRYLRRLERIFRRLSGRYGGRIKDRRHSPRDRRRRCLERADRNPVRARDRARCVARVAWRSRRDEVHAGGDGRPVAAGEA